MKRFICNQVEKNTLFNSLQVLLVEWMGLN